MDHGMLAKVAALRDEAFATCKALDDAVVTLGGKPRLPQHDLRQILGQLNATVSKPSGDRRLSQSGAAELILRERGVPATGADLLAALPSKGVTVSGDKPEVNFTSAMSKSGKFKSHRRDGKYYWWLKDAPLPPGWNNEAPDLLEGQSDASSVHSNQEGGEANATAT